MNNNNGASMFSMSFILKFIALILILSIIASATYNYWYFYALGIKSFPLTFRDYINNSIVFAPLLALLAVNLCNEKYDFYVTKNNCDSGIAKLLSIAVLISTFAFYYLFFGKQIFYSVTFYVITLTTLGYLIFWFLRHKANKGDKILQLATLFLLPFFLIIFPSTLGLEIGRLDLKNSQPNYVDIMFKDGSKLESVTVLRYLKKWIVIKQHNEKLGFVNKIAIVKINNSN